jgi:hypothetical protein
MTTMTALGEDPAETGGEPAERRRLTVLLLDTAPAW